MTNAELIATIRAEIERRIIYAIGFRDNVEQEERASFFNGEAVALKHLLSFLDTLESEKPMNQDELEKEINRFRTIFQYECDPRVINEVARHFAKWGAEHLGSSEIPNDLEEAAREATIKEGILAGPNFEVAVRTFKAGVKWRDSHSPKLPDNLDKAARKAAVAPFNFDLDEEHLYEYPYLPIAEQKFKEGAKWDREQMLKEAVEGEVVQDLEGVNRVKSFGKIPEGLHFGDKVKIIIVKE